MQGEGQHDDDDDDDAKATCDNVLKHLQMGKNLKAFIFQVLSLVIES